MAWTRRWGFVQNGNCCKSSVKIYCVPTASKKVSLTIITPTFVVTLLTCLSKSLAACVLSCLCPTSSPRLIISGASWLSRLDEHTVHTASGLGPPPTSRCLLALVAAPSVAFRCLSELSPLEHPSHLSDCSLGKAIFPRPKPRSGGRCEFPHTECEKDMGSPLPGQQTSI